MEMQDQWLEIDENRSLCNETLQDKKINKEKKRKKNVQKCSACITRSSYLYCFCYKMVKHKIKNSLYYEGVKLWDKRASSVVI